MIKLEQKKKKKMKGKKMYVCYYSGRLFMLHFIFGFIFNLKFGGG